MAELKAKSPCAGILPLTRGELTLSEFDGGTLTWIAPRKGQKAALNAALKAGHGLDWPAPGRSSAAGAARCLWTGMDQAVLMGPAPDAGLADCAALSAQSDGWALISLTGTDAAEVMARLVPVDLRPSALEVGQVVRTLCQHVSVTIWRENAETLVIMGFRSMAQTLVHEIEVAMSSVAAQRA